MLSRPRDARKAQEFSRADNHYNISLVANENTFMSITIIGATGAVGRALAHRVKAAGRTPWLIAQRLDKAYQELDC